MMYIMDPRDIERAKDAFEPLFNELKRIGAKGFELALKQNYVYAAWDILAIIGCFLLIVLASRFALIPWKWVKQQNKDIDKASEKKTYFDWEKKACSEDKTTVLVSWLVIIASLIAIIIVACFLSSRLINPEWATIMDIFKLVNGK